MQTISDALNLKYWELRNKIVTEPSGTYGVGERPSKLRQEQEKMLAQALVEYIENQVLQVAKNRRPKIMCRLLASFFGGECMSHLGIRTAFSEALMASKFKLFKAE
jgi:hypothetical protein